MVSSGGGGVAASDLARGLGGGSHHHHHHHHHQGLKKGPWTAAEDAILMEYVKKHGEGNWNAVQKNSGLMRCGKSCRLRWANHLRPNLKKGSFSPEEEKIIIELHAKLGNKWARMAAQLPGRTDNEIKNYWNTRMKRRQRAGLPIYPLDIQEKAAAAFHLQQQHHHHHHKRPQNQTSPPLSSLLASQNPTYNPSLSMFNNFNFQSTTSLPLQNHQAGSSFLSNNPNQTFQLIFDNNNGNNSANNCFSLPLSSPHPYHPPSSSASLMNQNIQTQTMPMSSFKFNSITGNDNFQRDMSFSAMINQPMEFGSGLEIMELPSTQMPPKQASPAASSGSSGGVCAMGISSNNTIDKNDYQISQKATSGGGNSGLLDALVQESHKMSGNEKIINNGHETFSDAGDKGKSVADGSSSADEEGNEGVESMMMANPGVANADNNNQWVDLSSSQSSIGEMKKTNEEPLEEMQSMDDDLMSLLNNFPLSMPLPEWYPGTSDASNVSSSSVTTGGNQEGTHHQPNASPTTPPPTTAASPELQWSLGSGRWKNMPGIC